MDLQSLLDIQRTIFDSYNHNVWTTLGMLLIALGWVITSAKARSLLRRSGVARWACCLAAVLVLAIHCTVLFTTQSRSQQFRAYVASTEVWAEHTRTPLVGDAHAEGSEPLAHDLLLDRYAIPRYFPFGSSILSFILAGTLVTILIRVKRDEGPSP